MTTRDNGSRLSALPSVERLQAIAADVGITLEDAIKLARLTPSTASRLRHGNGGRRCIERVMLAIDELRMESGKQDEEPLAVHRGPSNSLAHEHETDLIRIMRQLIDFNRGRVLEFATRLLEQQRPAPPLRALAGVSKERT